MLPRGERRPRSVLEDTPVSIQRRGGCYGVETCRAVDPTARWAAQISRSQAHDARYGRGGDGTGAVADGFARYRPGTGRSGGAGYGGVAVGNLRDAGRSCAYCEI